MNAIKTKNTKVGSFFLKAWVFAAARKKSFPVTPIGLFMCRVCCGNSFFEEFFWRILKRMFVFVTITQMKPERCKKAEKEQEPYKILQQNHSSDYVPFPSLGWALLTENFPCGGSQSRAVSWWSIRLHRESCQGWMWDEDRLWPLASPKIRPARETNWDGAHFLCPVCKPSL